MTAAADPGFEHATAPPRHAALRGDVVDPARLGEPADAAGFDVDYLAGSQLQGVARIARRLDAFVEADGGAELLLQGCVVDEVAGGDGLVEHQEAETIEPRPAGGPGPGIR